LPESFDETDQAWVLRAQRVVFFHWKVAEPWAPKGSITIAGGGDLAKEAGLLPDDALTPEVPTVYHSADPDRPVRMIIPKIKMNSPIAEFGLDQLLPDGSLPTPNNGNDVAWYDYSGRAGENNNAVFAGHVDWDGRSAVFARIKELVSGDQITLVGQNGTHYTYEVLGCDDVECHLPMSSRPDVDEFVGFSAFAHLTMITCEGQWDVIKHDYSNRRIVRARMIAETTSAGDAVPLLADQLPYTDYVYTADAAVLPRDAQGNPIRG
jgi:sortase (surface protein transpeptidase)